MMITLHGMLRRIVKENNIENYLEIGTREGCSLKNVLLDNNNIRNVFVSDLWGRSYGGSGRGSHEHILDLLVNLNFSGNCFFLDGDSRRTIPKLTDEYSNYFDLILVDGDHSYTGAMIDLENTWPLCKNGGIVVFDDITHPGHMYLDMCFDIFTKNKSNEILRTQKIYHGCGIV